MATIPPRDGVAFLLTQLGTHAAERFGERLSGLSLTPPDAGILRLLASAPGRSQQELAAQLVISPSRMVALIDDLEQKGLLERRRNPDDRRNYALALTAEGSGALERISRIGREHEDELCAGLSADERATLARLCRKIAERQGLSPGVHPGYRKL
jgi:DNA-binding MarR family transcriptional regulator